jgi:uncharacterized protein YbaA (DUF1428 family)
MAKGNYIDGFVLVVPKKNVPAYTKMAQEASRVWKKYGALDYKECVGNDINPDGEGPHGMTFPKMTKLKQNETVWFSYIVYKNKKHRDAVNKKVMDYFDKKYANAKYEDMPFDMKKVARGGFSVIVS